MSCFYTCWQVDGNGSIRTALSCGVEKRKVFLGIHGYCWSLQLKPAAYRHWLYSKKVSFLNFANGERNNQSVTGNKVAILFPVSRFIGDLVLFQAFAAASDLCQ